MMRMTVTLSTAAVVWMFYLTLCHLITQTDTSNAAAVLTSQGAHSAFSPGGQYIMLTFSAGPHYLVTPLILDILKEKKVKATFFISGLKAMYHRDLLHRMHSEGHELANHGFHSVLFTDLSFEDIASNVLRTSGIISNVTNSQVKYFRPPKGHTTAEINEVITKEHDMKVILWSLDAHDAVEKDPARIVVAVVRRAKPGDVILLHDINPHTAEALPTIIDKLHEQGYEFLTISEIMSFPDDSPH